MIKLYNSFKLITCMLLLFFAGSSVFGQITENFDSGLASSYTTGTQTLSSGDWECVSVFQESSTNSVGGTGNAVRINDDTAGASIASPSLNTVGTVTFYYRELNSGGGTFALEKSISGGAFTEITTQAFSGNTFTEFTFDVNESSSDVVLRIVNDNNPGHLIIDDFSTTTYSAGPDTDAPVFQNSTPSASSITEVGFDIDVELDEVGTAYYVVLANGGSAPSTAQIEAGTDGGDAAALESGTITVSAGNTNYNETITGLSSATDYDVYVFAKDASDNATAVQTVIDVTTLTDVAPTLLSAATSTESTSSTIVLIFSEIVTATDATGFSVTIGGAGATVNAAITGSGTNELTLTIVEEITKSSGTVELAYSGTGDVADLTPNSLASFTATTVTNNATLNEVSDISAARALGLGEEVRITSEVVITFQGNSADKIYVQDANAGLLIDDNGTINTVYTIGDGIINLTGTLVDGNGVMELAPLADPGTANSNGNSITPIEVTISDFAADIDTYESRYVKIVNVSFDDAGSTFSNFNNYTITDGVDNLTFRPNFSDLDFSSTDAPYGQVDVYALAGEFNGSEQVLPYSNTEFFVDGYAPQFTVAPATANVASGGFDVTFQSDEPGIVYYVVNEVATTLTAAEVLAGTSEAYTDVTGTDVTINIGSLNPGTQYYVHILLEDDETSPNQMGDADVVTVTATTGSNDADSDITAVASGETSDIDYAAFQDASTLTDGTSVSLFTFSLNDSGSGDAVSTILTDISFDITNFENLRTLALFDGTTNLSEVAVSSATVDFTGLTIEATTGASKEINVRATFLDVVDDEEQIQLTISSATADGAGSSFAAADAGGAASSIATADLNAIEVTATTFNIDAPSLTAPTSDFTVTVTAVDASGNTDIAARSVSLSLNTGTGNLSSSTGLTAQVMTNGVYSWTDVQYDTEEDITVDVSDGSITVTSGTITIFTTTGGVFISQYIDGSGSNKAVEVYNNTGGDIDLSEYKLGLYSNGSATIGNNIVLSDIAPTLANGELVVVTNASANDPNIIAASDITSTITFFNGDDAVALLYNDVVIDVIGEIGNDPGTGWDVAGVTEATADHTLVRKSSVTEGNATNLASFGTNATDSEWEVLDYEDYTGIGSHTVDVAGAPLITIDASSFNGDFGATTVGVNTASSSFDVTGTDLTANITITAPSGFEVSTDDFSFGASAMLTESGGSASGTIYVHFLPDAVQSYNDVITLSSTDANNKTVAVSGTGLSADAIFFEGFDTCPSSSMITFSVASNEDWGCGTGNSGEAAYISGFGADVASDDWLITPAIDLSSATNAALTFYSYTKYTDQVYPPIEVLASSNYSGSGDPSSATWTSFDAIFSPEDSETWTASGDVDLSSFVGGDVYVAFHYTTTDVTGGNVADWAIDEILVEDRASVANPSFAVTESLTDFGSVDNGSTSSSQSFTVEGADLQSDITVTASSNFEVSLNDTDFSASVALSPTSGTLSSTTVHVRFAPSSGINGAVTGTITLSTTNATNQTIDVSGTEAGNATIENDLFISEYVESTGNRKAIEIFNGTGATVDLSNYTLKQSHNGVGFGNDPVADVYDLPLSGMLDDGDVFVVYNMEADTVAITNVGDLGLTYGDTGDGVRVTAFNGDDAIGLFKNGVLIDLFGDPNNDPGAAWDVAGVTEATLDHILVRKESVNTGNTTPLGSFGTSESNSEWIVLEVNDFSSLGSHSVVVLEPGLTIDDTDFTSNFGQVGVGSESTVSTYTLSATQLTEDLVVTVPAGFVVALDNGFAGIVGNSTTPMNVPAATINDQTVTVFVKFAPSVVGSVSGNIVHSSAGFDAQNLAVSGEGVEGTTTGLDELAKHNINVYPNPSADVLNISIPQSFGEGQIRLLNLNGKEVVRGQIGSLNTINTSVLNNGIYVLQISNAETVINHRVVVK